MMVLAVTLHNIPEGLAVGVVIAGMINGNINEDEAWKGEIHQLDVYTTILDILDIMALFYFLRRNGNPVLAGSNTDSCVRKQQ